MTPTLLTFLQTLVTPGKKHLQSGACLFQPGDPATSLYGVERGVIRMVRFNDEGRETVVYRAGAGETFAEASLFGDSYHCAVVAESDCLLLLFPKHDILRVMDKEPQLLWQYSALLSRQVRELRSLLEVRSILAADERVLHYLHLHADANGRCLIPSSLMDLAGQLGLAHETLYRSMKKLVTAGTIRRKGLEIFLL